MLPLPDWPRLVTEHGPEPEAFLAQVRSKGVLYGDRPLCRHRRPVVLRRQTVATYDRILAHFTIAVRACRRLIVEDGLEGSDTSLAVRLGIPRPALALARLEPADASAATLARVDSFLVEGHPWLIELNAESPAGLAYGDALAELFLEDPLCRRQGPWEAMPTLERALDAVLAHAEDRRRSGQPLRVALVDRLPVPTEPEFHLIVQALSRRGIAARVSDVRSLRFTGSTLADEHGPIDLVYRRLLIADALAEPEAVAPLLAAVEAGAVTVVNGFLSSLLHGKGLFALLADPRLQARLPAPVAHTIREHVPWTGILGDRPGVGSPPGLREQVARERLPWVLKPLRGHGGQGVLIGRHSDPATWEAAVAQARQHVVQRYVPLPHLPFPDAEAGYAPEELIVSLDPFLVHGRLAGFLSRVAPTPLANVAQGAGQVPVLVEGLAARAG